MENQQSQKVKSYTERFREMEDQLGLMSEQYTEASQAFQITATIIQDLSVQIRMLNDQLQAIYDLGVVSRDMVSNKINERRVSRVRDLIDRDEKSGLVKKIEEISSENDIVVYSNEEVSLAFKAVAAFTEDGLANLLLGKKTGETVGGITIDSIYSIVQQAPTTESAPQ